MQHLSHLVSIGRCPRAIAFIAAFTASLAVSVCRGGEPKADFAETVRSVRQAIFQVGSDEGHGTAWVLSKKHRLLATNAHVADIYSKSRVGTFKAIMNGSDVTYTVDKVWYHPGVTRYTKDGENLPIRPRQPPPGGYLGMAFEFGLDGLKVTEVLPNTPAIKAGIKIGDHVLALNGAIMQDGKEFLAALARKNPGDAVTLKIARGEKELNIKATLGEWPADPKFGNVFYRCPDVAVLRLAKGGPDLPVELKMAPPNVVFDLQARSVAMMGFPGHDTETLPRPGQIVQATYHKGDVSRVTDFRLEGSTAERAQFLQYTQEGFSGFSGSPVFLASGEVVGVHNSARPVDPRDRKSRRLAQGVRVDCLWELLVHHELDRLVEVPLPKEKLLIARWLEPDPNEKILLQLRKLAAEADYLTFTKQDCTAAIDKCNQAIKIYPDYAPAYAARARANLQLRYLLPDQQKKQRLSCLDKAAKDVDENLQLHGDRPTVDTLCLELTVLSEVAWETNKKQMYDPILQKIDKVLAIKGLSDWDRSRFLRIKANALSDLGKREDALRLYSTILKMFPDEPTYWDQMGVFLKPKNPQQARTYFGMGDSLRKYASLGAESKWKEFKLVSEVKEKLTAQDPKDNRGCHRHVWDVELEAGYYYRIELKNPTFKTDKDYDPFLRVTDDNNKILFEDDDGGGYPNARIYFTATRSGYYKMIASSCYVNQTGTYVLTVTRVAKDR